MTSTPVAQVRRIENPRGQDYDALVFWCPGCEFIGEDGEPQGGAHMLPVTDPGDSRPLWAWDRNVASPTLSPSILSNVPFRRVNGEVVSLVCHSFLRAGLFEFLSDCTHQYAGQTVPMVPLPDWLVKEVEA